jgi:hypothetical protein
VEENEMKRILVFLLTLCLIISLCGCGKVIDKYDSLITAYQSAQKAAANGQVAVAMGFNKIQNYMDIYNQYLSADVAKTKAYRDALASYGAKLADQQKMYVDQSGNALDPNNIDLAKLVENQATPADMALNVSVYASTFNEAPLEKVDVTSLTNTQKLISEAYNEIYANIKDWNDAVGVYNTERNKATGDIVGRAAEYLKVNELPQKLPYFSMPITNLPSATTKN